MSRFPSNVYPTVVAVSPACLFIYPVFHMAGTKMHARKQTERSAVKRTVNEIQRRESHSNTRERQELSRAVLVIGVC